MKAEKAVCKVWILTEVF